MARCQSRRSLQLGTRRCARYAASVSRSALRTARSCPSRRSRSPSIRQASWPGRGAGDRLVELDSQPRGGGPPVGVAPAMPRRGSRQRRAVAQLDAVDRVAVAVAGARRAARTRVVSQRLARADRDACCASASVASTYSGSSARDAEPAALADREAVVAAVAAEHGAVRGRRSRPGASPSAAVACEERGRLVPARKQRSCESALARRPAARPRRASSRDLGLGRARRAGSACRASDSGCSAASM